MTITLELSPEDESRLREKAAAHGQSLPDYLKSVAERDAGSIHRNGRGDGGDEDSNTTVPGVATQPGDAVVRRAAAALNNRTPEQIAQDRARVFAAARPARPLPPGKTLEDVVVGKWPGDETEEQILAALDELS